MAQAQKSVTQKDVQVLQRMKSEITAISRRVSELEQQRDEHKFVGYVLTSNHTSLVIKTLSKLEPTRKCFRMVGGVLVQRTVSEVLPAVTQSKETVFKYLINFVNLTRWTKILQLCKQKFKPETNK